MKPSNLYAIILTLTYALLFWLGNSDHNTASGWNKEVAPWLGELPAGVESETVRAKTADGYPCTYYLIPHNEEMKQKIISTFQLIEGKPGYYFSDEGITPRYPEDKEVDLKTFETIYPILEVEQRGLRFCPNDANTQGNPSAVKFIDIPYPQYLPDSATEMQRSLMLAVLCYMFPGVFCCVGWLWIQKNPIRSRETLVICLAIPAAVAFVGAFADFYIHGFHRNYAVFSAVFSVVTNLISAGIVIALTAPVKYLWRTIWK